MRQPTVEERTALSLLALLGQTFHRTEEKKLPCGCWVVAGWRTDTFEPSGGFVICGEHHRAAATRAHARWGDEESVERFRDTPAIEALAILLGEEIDRCG